MTYLARFTDWRLAFWLVNSNPPRPKKRLTMSDVIMVETSAGVLYWPIIEESQT